MQELKNNELAGPYKKKCVAWVPAVISRTWLRAHALWRLGRVSDYDAIVILKIVRIMANF